MAHGSPAFFASIQLCVVASLRTVPCVVASLLRWGRSPDRATWSDRRSPEARGDHRSGAWHGPETSHNRGLPHRPTVTLPRLATALLARATIVGPYKCWAS